MVHLLPLHRNLDTFSTVHYVLFELYFQAYVICTLYTALTGSCGILCTNILGEVVGWDVVIHWLGCGGSKLGWGDSLVGM